MYCQCGQSPYPSSVCNAIAEVAKVAEVVFFCLRVFQDLNDLNEKFKVTSALDINYITLVCDIVWFLWLLALRRVGQTTPRTMVLEDCRKLVHCVKFELILIPARIDSLLVGPRGPRG